MTITVYSTPTCTQCQATYTALQRRGIPYRVVDLTTDPAALEHVRQLGYQAAPVVETPTGHWSGFRPDKLTALPRD